MSTMTATATPTPAITSKAHRRSRWVEARVAVLDCEGKVESYSSEPWHIKAAEAAEMIADGRAIFDGEGRIAVSRTPREIRGWSCNLSGRKIEQLATERTLRVAEILQFLLQRHPRHGQADMPTHANPAVNDAQAAP